MKARRRRGEGCIYLRGHIWWIKYPLNGEEMPESSGSEKESDARKLLKRRLGEIVIGRFIGPDAEKVTVSELADDVVNDYRINAKDSLDKAERSANRIKGFFGGYKAHSIGTDLVKKYIAQRQADGAANATINRELAFLKRGFNLGIQAEKILRKPYIPMLKENNVRQGFFERSEFIAFRAALADYLRPVATFAYYTGWRKQNILDLQWNQVDLNARTVRLHPGTTKNDEGQVIVLDGELLDTVRAQWEKRKVVTIPGIPGQSPTLLCSFVFHRGGRQIKDPRKSWNKARAETGLSTKMLHDFRRTAARDLVRGGVNELVAMKITGHKTRSVFDRYNIVNEDDLRDAARKHSEYVQSQDKASNVVALKRVGENQS
jgi:integrase